MNTEEIKTYRQKLEEEIRHKAALLEAYKLVEADIESRDVPPVEKPPVESANATENAKPQSEVATNGAVHNGSNGNSYGENSRIVRNAISHMEGNYSVRTLYSWLKVRGVPIAKDQVGTVLNRLREKGEITVCRYGSGRRPTTYKVNAHETISPETGQNNGGAD
jgi:hypothetical protein